VTVQSDEKEPRDLEAVNVRDFLDEAARAVADETFLVHDGKEVSYREFNHRVDAAASVWHDMGVRKGDRVAFMMENRAKFLQASRRSAESWLPSIRDGKRLKSRHT